MNKYQPRDFKWRHFHGEVIMQCVRWYCKYGISFNVSEPKAGTFRTPSYGCWIPDSSTQSGYRPIHDWSCHLG